MLLEVLLGRGDQLDGGELVAATRLVGEVSSIRKVLGEVNVPPPLEAADDLANEATLEGQLVCYCIGVLYASLPYLDTVRLDGDEAVNPVSLSCRSH